MTASHAGAAVALPDEESPLHVSPRARFEILGAVLLGLFLSALDQTIVGPILPKVVTALHGGDFYVWVATSYLVTSTVTVPIYGKLSDLFGRKPMLMAGIGLFLLGSALSGLSQEMWQLILFRGVQGLGAGALFPISLAVIGDLFTPRERGKYQGLFGAVFGVAFLVGPGLGGLLTDNFSWHWVFYVNIPIGLLALFVIWRLLPTVRRPDAANAIDWAGVGTFAVAIVPILIGLTNAENGDWGNPNVWGLVLVGLVFLGIFVWVESRAREPMIPLHLFRVRTFSISMLAVFLAMFGFFGAVYFLPLWFQVVKGASATASGYDLLPFLIGLIGSSVVSGIVVSRTGRYKWLLVGGLALAAAGVTLMTNIRADTSDMTLWLWMLVTGVGIGPTMAVFTIIVQNAVPFEELGAATSDLTLFRQMGGVVGLTLSFTLFRNFLSWDAIRTQIAAAGVPSTLLPTSAPPGFDSGALTNVGSGGPDFLSQVPAQLQPAFVEGIHRAFSIALGNAMWLGVGAMTVAVLGSILLHELPLRQHFGDVAEAEQEREASERPRAIAFD